MTLDSRKADLAQILHPVAEALGVGLDGRLGALLMPRSWDMLPAEHGVWVHAGGRRALAPNGEGGSRRSWSLAAAIVLAAAMFEAAEERAYFHEVARRAAEAHDRWASDLAPRIPDHDELRTALLASSTLLLSEGWVINLGDVP